MTEEQLKKLGLYNGQVKSILFVKEKRKISNAEYQKFSSVSKATATRDPAELTEKFNLLGKVGQTATGTSYTLKSDLLIMNSPNN